MPSNILIVEDEPAIAELLAVNLRHAGHCPIVAGSAEEALRLIRDVLPDVMLVDWMLPGMSGVALLRELRQGARTRAIPMILLTARSEETDTIAGLDAGADDYITKPFSPKELLARIRAVLRRRSPQLTDEPVRAGALAVDPGTRRVTYTAADGAEKELRLGPTEFKLLHFMMTHPERVHSRGALLDKVWGDHVFIEERTVDVHIKRLREALAPANCSELVETVRGAGYRFTQRQGATTAG
ncbi:phosphate regulon transcriptional regulator PhoB [Thiomonas sp.]|jgi:two-component system phosphate regulon response regulator PhoB|uniref:phosphate regulon transcriptional regulator PhoB n=1 Tax=Thiomonas sp. TaxID=2047785 RepID=UPI002627E23E|nr:phosphate regulon transcriptional regulator PhoB [Thiomonas sp.]